MIGEKHPDDLSSIPKVGIVIYDKFGVQIWEKIQFQWREIKLNEKGEKIQKREKILKKTEKLEKKIEKIVIKNWKNCKKNIFFH
jgi:hypothetical protein